MDKQPNQIYKGSCVICRKSFYLKQQKNCPHCQNELKSKLIYKNPIGNPTPKNLIITKSFGKLDPENYSENDILHIGISDSKGNIYSFWNNFIIDDKNNPFWRNNSLSVDLKLTISDEIWDNCIQINRNSQQQNPATSKYHSMNNNCFDYVVRFLNDMNFQENKNWNKDDLAEKIIEPKVEEMEKYCNIYQQLYVKCSHQYIETNIAPASCDQCQASCTENNRYKCIICDDYDLCNQCFQQQKHQHPLLEFW